uniref:Plastid-encoded RNA polymerase subunit alpha n=1 Tax=Callipsygma wilsonis TaxID=2320807 RepID=A0A386AZX5_9CHLO|nr:RNA polymerase a-subunit [Callipsygma wilsonis]AYC64994.1 RNA polymerase a-subunit [Callipsygma wilsonis]
MPPKNFYCISSRIEKTGQLYGCFKIGPFQDQSLTFANSLRRILLTDQSKCTLHAVQIYGIKHEFSTIVGIRESLIDLLFNIEKCIFRSYKPITKPRIGFINFCGPGIIRAQHIHLPTDIQCIDPLKYIATVEIDGQLTLKIIFASNLFENSVVKIKENFIYLKNSQCSIEKVNYTIPSKRYVFLEIWTDGSLHPQEAIFKAINKFLLDIFPFSYQQIQYFKELALEESKLELELESESESESESKKKSKKKIFNESAFLNLEIGNFYFDLETYIFLKKEKINRIIDFLFFVKMNKQKSDSILKFQIFVYSFLQKNKFYFNK